MTVRASLFHFRFLVFSSFLFLYFYIGPANIRWNLLLPLRLQVLHLFSLFSKFAPLTLEPEYFLQILSPAELDEVFLAKIEPTCVNQAVDEYKHICPNCKMYLSKLQNVFVQIPKCISPRTLIGWLLGKMDARLWFVQGFLGLSSWWPLWIILGKRNNIMKC